MKNVSELLLAQILSLVTLYREELEDIEHVEEKKPVGRPRKFETSEHRKKYHQAKLKAEKYSSKYYNENKCRVPCQYCGKDINSLAKNSHYKSRSCLASRETEDEEKEEVEPRILFTRKNI